MNNLFMRNGLNDFLYDLAIINKYGPTFFETMPNLTKVEEKQDKQHFCKDCKWSGIKNKTDRVCTHSRWNSGNTCTDVKDNDFCSYWEKKNTKIVLNYEEFSFLKSMKSFGYNFIQVFRNPMSGTSIFFTEKEDKGCEDFYCNMNVKSKKFPNIEMLDSKNYKIDDLLKG